MENNVTISARETIFRGQITEVVSKIENGHDDVSTFATNTLDIPFKMQEWIQIAGPLYLGKDSKDDVWVFMCIASRPNLMESQESIYGKHGFTRCEDNPLAFQRYYKQSEMYNMVDDIEQIVYAIAGTQKFIVGPEEFTKTALDKIAEERERQKKAKKSEILFGVVAAIIALIILGILSIFFA